jgi:hypothetical protein
MSTLTLPSTNTKQRATMAMLIHLYHPNRPEHRAGSTSQPCSLERDHDAPMHIIAKTRMTDQTWAQMRDCGGGQRGTEGIGSVGGARGSRIGD